MKNDPFYYLSYVLKVYRSMLLVREYCHTLVEASCRCEYNPHDRDSCYFIHDRPNVKNTDILFWNLR